MAAYKPWAEQQALQKIEATASKGCNWLVLERLGLAQLPEEIFELTQLEDLVVIDNLLTTLPAEIAGLHHLTRLDLFYNQIETLPAEIGSLTKLTHLNLSCNQLTHLPPEITNLTNLQYLNLYDNPLPIPEEVLAQVYQPQKIIEAYLAELVPVRV